MRPCRRRTVSNGSAKMMAKRHLPLLLSVLLGGLALQQPVLAQEHAHWHRDHPHGYDWNHWRRGGWINGWHEGRMGWWWVVDGVWFYYAQPVYPVPQPPTVVATPVPQVPPGYYYYCPNPAGYYPTVPQCLTGWQLVPSAPAPQQPAPSVAAPPPPAPPAAVQPPR